MQVFKVKRLKPINGLEYVEEDKPLNFLLAPLAASPGPCHCSPTPSQTHPQDDWGSPGGSG